MRINASQGSDAMLELQKRRLAEAAQNIQPPNGQLSGNLNPNASQVAQHGQGGASEGSKVAATSAIGEMPAQKSVQAADPHAKLKQEEQSAAANALMAQEKPGAMQLAMVNQQLLVKKKELQPDALA